MSTVSPGDKPTDREDDCTEMKMDIDAREPPIEQTLDEQKDSETQTTIEHKTERIEPELDNRHSNHETNQKEELESMDNNTHIDMEVETLSSSLASNVPTQEHSDVPHGISSQIEPASPSLNPPISTLKTTTSPQKSPTTEQDIASNPHVSSLNDTPSDSATNTALESRENNLEKNAQPGSPKNIDSNGSNHTANDDVDMSQFDAEFFSLNALELSKDGKSTMEEISFPLLDGEEFKESDFKITDFKNSFEDSFSKVKQEPGDDLFQNLSSSNDVLEDNDDDLVDSGDLDALGDLADEDIFPEDIDELPMFDEMDGMDQESLLDASKALSNLEELSNGDLENLSIKDIDSNLDMSSNFDLKSQEDLRRDVSQSALDKIENSPNKDSTDLPNPDPVLATPRQIHRAQSEALDTHIQKPKLQAHPASVPHSPSESGPSNMLFLPRSFNSPLSKSGSPASKRPSVFLKPRHADKSSTLQAINGAAGERPEMQQYPTGGDEDAPPRVSAYARLDFLSFTFYVQTLQVILGRGAENGSMVDVDLGPVKAISRRHAKIFYNFGTQRFEMSVLGRNGAFVDDTFIDSGSTVPLKDG